MKLQIRILLFLSLPFCAMGQDTTIVISGDTFFGLSNVNGWYFRRGDDTTWARKDLSIAGWEKIKPPQLSQKIADKNGKLEGWLRLKFRLDSSFKDTVPDLVINSWAAMELYVDGQLLYTFGNCGRNGRPFEEYNPTYKLPVTFNVSKGVDHTLAIHYVDFISPFPPFHLKSDGRLQYFIAITTPTFMKGFFEHHMETQFYKAMWLSVNVILSLLFWVLAFQNRAEKNLLLIALITSVITLDVYCDPYVLNPGLSYFTGMVLIVLWPILISVAAFLGLLIMVRIFGRKLTMLTKIIMGVIFACGIMQIFVHNIFILVFELSLGVVSYAYYVISSWKTLKGAQWAVVWGFLLTMILGLALGITAAGIPGPNNVIMLLYTGLFLSFPLSLLIYVATRFREVIKEVRNHSEKIVKMSEEKKQQALHQQELLQEEVNRQTAELRNTLEDLKSTQTQLIQSEKMASLGELTAGIAHEIQNPLNFVNNFSEVSSELLDEMKNEMATGNGQEARAIADDVKQNLEKIIHHGKRADAIVKGMLQHSRTSTGQKELTDINSLADEYLRLSYHGLRAKDKSFNASFKTDFDQNIGKINIIPQDIGRVLLNLFTNAFYSVTEKNKHHPANYEPWVSVSTKKLKDKVEIKIKDNGMGIPQKVMEKIFQPFFTTKPTGQGTGLGLSLSYDIVTKGHGGELSVETQEGEFAEFIIMLPIH